MPYYEAVIFFLPQSHAARRRAPRGDTAVAGEQ